MAIFKIEVTAYRCNICGYSWLPRYRDSPTPEVCAKCRSKYWNQPRPEKQPRPPGHGLAADMINEIMQQQHQPTTEEYRHTSIAAAAQQQRVEEQTPKAIMMAEQKQEEQQQQPIKGKSRRDSDTPT